MAAIIRKEDNMSKINMDVFFDEAFNFIDKVHNTQSENIENASRIMSDCIKNDGVVHVFGSGHSIGFGMELTGKPGSLVPIHFIETTDFVTRGLYTYEDFRDKTNIFERRPGVATALYDLYDVHEQDVFIIISNSGINGLVIDLADTAKKKGHKIIILTSWDHTNAEPSRHPSGKKLYEFGDVVIDNCGPRGDAMLETGGKEKVGSISSITGAVIAQSMTENMCEMLLEADVPIPLLKDESSQENRDHNTALFKKYAGRI